MFDPISWALAKRASMNINNIWQGLVTGEFGWGEIITNFNYVNMLTGVGGSGAVQFSTTLNLKTGGAANSYAWAGRGVYNFPFTPSKFVLKSRFASYTTDNPYSSYLAVGDLVSAKTTGSSTIGYVGILDEGSTSGHTIYLVTWDRSTNSETKTEIYSTTSYAWLDVQITADVASYTYTITLTDGYGNRFTKVVDGQDVAGQIKLPFTFYIDDGTNASNAMLQVQLAAWSVMP